MERTGANATSPICATTANRILLLRLALLERAKQTFRDRISRATSAFAVNIKNRFSKAHGFFTFFQVFGSGEALSSQGWARARFTNALPLRKP